ncbi:ABC-F family ATP-binding cassette domain-containing protein [Desulfonatronovibrio hydrogenovorans]|uniref:ABC-F family ATP-binding cassette domain-containing protein n=1 Tax=Desulfonatronovibrio hydrogenovorans TaxID=53245 RepID=UPI00048C3099|nr:ABC-F family ATP-binding cassette domain-containing protein [Desulfonatronovibrio hydrogenovorans]
MKITINNISKSYSGEDLFKDLSFEINSGNRLAVTGPNGCGKTTLLRMLAGLAGPDTGSINLPRGLKTGYVVQELDSQDLKTPLLEYVLDVLPDWGEFWRKWKQAIAREDSDQLTRLSHVQAEMEQAYGYNPEYKAEKILNGLGFEEKTFGSPLRSLSGGWRERAKLSRVLLQGADLLILDEPTNHLDMEAVLWLEDYLLSFSGMLVLVAHDRFFLDRVVTHILHLGFDRPYFRPGNYSSFVDWHEQRELLKEKERDKIQGRIKHLQSFVDRFRYKATKARQAQARLNRINKLSSGIKDFQEDQKGKSLNFSWPAPRRASRVAITCAGLKFTHPGKPVLLDDLSFQLFHGQKIALMGPNGSGKSTLFKLIMDCLEPEQGYVRLGRNTYPGYFTQHQTETLVLENTVLTEIRRLATGNPTEEEIRSVLGLFMLDESFWERRAMSLSGGEKSRLILASLFLTRANLLLLDEPTNHLDMESREALIAALKDFPGAVFIIAHDRYLLSQVAGEVWTMENQGITQHGHGFDLYYDNLLTKGRESCSQEKGPAVSRDKKEGTSQKQRRRQEAQARNQAYRLLKPLKAEYSHKESRLEECLARQEEVEAIMARPETYQEPEKFKTLNLEYQALVEENEMLMARLEKLEQEIGSLESRKP